MLKNIGIVQLTDETQQLGKVRLKKPDAVLGVSGLGCGFVSDCLCFITVQFLAW